MAANTETIDLRDGAVRTVYVTAPNRDEALSIAKIVVGERLAACANVIDTVGSVYWWEGELQEDVEAALILKTQQNRVPDLCARIQAVHSYDCPCITTFKIDGGNTDYLNWIVKETQ
jgi:periplasmic divalent cation tolerance protein